MVNRKATPLDLECQKGEVVFYTQVVHSSEMGKIFAESQDAMASYFQHVAKLSDDRLLVLTAELMIESAVENYLSAIMPEYENMLANNRGFSFSLGIKIAKALRLSPSKLFDGADTVRRIRNEFVHNLETKTFEELNPKLINEMELVLRTYFPKQPLTRRPPREAFKGLALFTLLGITSYVPNIRSLSSFLRDDAFLQILEAFLNERNIG